MMDAEDDDAMEIDMDAPIAIALKRCRKASRAKRRKTEPQPQNHASASPQLVEAPSKISVSEFDYSVENHFRAVDRIAELCGHGGTLVAGGDQSEIRRFSDSITFLREWRDFNYAPRVVRFGFQHNSNGIDVIGETTLPQFSSASVPKKEALDWGKTCVESSKDFVMHVGGAVWALDWCPRVDCASESHVKSEFVAIAAHPPESSYHKIGSPLTGRGAVQIWCLLTACVEDAPSLENKRSRPNSKSKGTIKAKDPTRPKRPKGRPRKRPLDNSAEKTDSDSQHLQPLAIEYPEFSGRSSGNATEHVSNEDSGRTQECVNQTEDVDLSMCCAPGNANTFQNPIPEDVMQPRIMLCLAHNGKVAWDVKWRPINACDPVSIYRMGYLAVLLGNGALEVWEVPLPHMMKLVFPACQEHIDPRFIKLKPVFRCSMLKCSGRQSIPLTVEWSVSSPHDMILAGCHDGVVALWKFSVTDSSTETRPLLSFSADTGPIRTLAWAPFQSDCESSNVIVTAGHKGFKFWDVRDPFRPLWDHPIPCVTYSLDWLPDPRCVFGSMDDGTLWLLNLEKAVHDIPITGKPLSMSSKHGFHSFICSSYSMWSVQASRLTGMVAYCGEEGTTLCFQPTTRSIRDPSRNRVHHYLCGSILEEECTLTVVTPLTNGQFQEKTPNLKRPGVGKDQEIGAKPQMVKGKTQDKQPLAICYGNDPGNGHGSKSNESSSSQLKAADQEMRGEKVIEVFPPKNVAMHRVRWNVNKGSEKWLCYGGAAGLLRCQEIVFPTS